MKEQPREHLASTATSIEAIWRLTRQRIRSPFIVRISSEQKKDYRSDRARSFRQRTGIVVNAVLAALLVYAVTVFLFPEAFVTFPPLSLFLAVFAEVGLLLLSRKVYRLRVLQIIGVATMLVPLYLLIRFSVLEPAYFLLVVLVIGFIFPWNGWEALLASAIPGAAYVYLESTTPGRGFEADDFLAFLLSLVIVGGFQTTRDRERKITFLLESDAASARFELLESLRVAARLHEDILSDDMESPTLSAKVYYEPMQHLGGDYVKMLPLTSERTSMFVADVTGHGIPSALMINRVNALIERLMLQASGPAASAAMLNNFITRTFSGTGILMSGQWIDYDAEKGTLTWSNYGHPPAILIDQVAGTVTSLPSHFPLMGVDVVETGQEETIEVVPGQLMLFYTDGLIEFETKAGRFDLPALMQYLKEKNWAKEFNSAESCLMDLVKFIKAQRQGETKDDLLMVVWEFK